MSSYSQWVAAGRPLTPAQPIEDLCQQLAAAYPDHANSFNWYADEAHYQADPPLDHTPYSVDGWPVADPQWFVCATDVMAASIGGVDQADALFTYWIAEARAGRMPWLKYLIWRATIYDVRHGWVAQPNEDHFDHIHVSARTDAIHHSLTGWSALPRSNGDSDMPYLVNIKGQSTVWVSNGAWRHRLEPGQAALFDQLKAKWGAPWLVDNEDQLEYVAGRDVATVTDGGPATLVPHKHDGGATGPAIAV